MTILFVPLHWLETHPFACNVAYPIRIERRLADVWSEHHRRATDQQATEKLLRSILLP